MRRRVSACALIVAAAATASAQPSTVKLEPGSDVRFELGAGSEWLRFSGGNSGSVLGVYGTVRREFDESGVALRLDGLWLKRSFEGQDQSGARTTASSQLMGLMGVADFEFRIGPEAAIAGVAGLGIAPWAHSTFTSASGGNGTLWTAGLIIRVRKLIVRQHMIWLLGMEHVIPQFREYYPLTIGWRF